MDPDDEATTRAIALGLAVLWSQGYGGQAAEVTLRTADRFVQYINGGVTR